MKLVFICGCLESGKDGVGDYTRRLSGQLIQIGFDVGIIAFKDGFVSEVKEEYQQVEASSVLCLRLPITMSSKRRTNIIKNWIDLKNPDWLSLQFVIYSFNPKGLPFTIGRQLKKISGNRKWHLMFHELWLGLKENDSLKYNIIGFFQVLIVKSLIKKIRVEESHTHTRFYEFHLRRLGLTPNYLPLFSNIPLTKKNSKDYPPMDSDEKIFVFFGLIHPTECIEKFINEVVEYFRNKSTKCRFNFIGNCGSNLKKWVDLLSNTPIKFKVYGRLSTEDISYHLHSANFGITTNPIFVVEKSGTVAAMREHNLPVLIVANGVKPKVKLENFNEIDFFEYEEGNFEEFMRTKFSSFKSLSLPEVANVFIDSLNKTA